MSKIWDDVCYTFSISIWEMWIDVYSIETPARHLNVDEDKNR